MSDPFDLPHEQTLSTARGFDGGRLHVRVDQVRLPSGRLSEREVVEHPGAVAILALTTANEVIMVRQWRYAIGRPLLEIPAGTREPGEPEIETARRELLEETSYQAESIREIARFYTSAGYSDEEMWLFLAEGCTLVDQPTDEDERTEVVLIPLADLDRLLVPGPEQSRDAKTLIATMWLRAGRPS